MADKYTKNKHGVILVNGLMFNGESSIDSIVAELNDLTAQIEDKGKTITELTEALNWFANHKFCVPYLDGEKMQNKLPSFAQFIPNKQIDADALLYFCMKAQALIDSIKEREADDE